MIEQYTEQNLIWYINQFTGPGEPLANCKGFPGHNSGDIDALPRFTLSALDRGGPLAFAGISDLIVQIIIVSPAADENNLVHARRVAAIRGIFQASQLATVIAALNAPAEGVDPRPQPGYGFTSITYDDEQGNADARDPKKGEFGTSIPFKAIACLL